MRARTRNRSSSGFTLLEIIVTLVLLAVGVTVLAQAFSTGIFASSDIESVELALNVAQSKMEEIRNTAFANISSSGPTADANFSSYNVTVTVTGTDPKQVAVSVAWNTKGGEVSVGLTTLVANCSCY